MSLDRENSVTPKWETRRCVAASVLAYVVHQLSGRSWVTASPFPSPVFMSRVTWSSDTDQKMKRSRGKLAIFLARSGHSVGAVGSAQGKGTRGLSNWGLRPETHFLAIFILRWKGGAKWWQSPCPKEKDGKAFSAVHPALWKLLPLVQRAQTRWWASGSTVPSWRWGWRKAWFREHLFVDALIVC